MPAFLIPAAIAGGIALAQAIPKLVRSKQEKENAKRLAELDAMGNAMGLTPAERAEIEAQYANQLEGAQRASERQTRAALANSVSSGSGQALQYAGQAATDAQRAGREAIADINSLDAQRRAELEQEREDRLAFQSAARQSRAQALVSVPAAALSGGLQGAQQAQLLGALRSGGETAAPTLGAALSAAGAAAPAAGGALANLPAADLADTIRKLSPADLERLRELMTARGLDTSTLPPPPALGG